jgi:N-acetylmuramoyl-L-alanine amidase
MLALCTLLAACSPAIQSDPGVRAAQAIQAAGTAQDAQALPTPVIPGMPSCYCPMPTAEATVAVTATAEAMAGQPTPTQAAGAAAGTETGKIVAVDPGHGGIETGAVSPSGLIEKNVNLKIALKLAALLTAGGYTPVLTRDSDRQVNTAGADLNGDGVVDNNDDLQARVDIANRAHADILVSIHNDSSSNPGVHGTRVYYSLDRPFVDRSIKLASALQAGIVDSLRETGYDVLDEGIGDDGPLKKPYGHLFLLGPVSPRVARASNMPGALGESLYLSNPVEGALLARDDILTAIAKGYYDGIKRYFASP